LCCAKFGSWARHLEMSCINKTLMWFGFPARCLNMFEILVQMNVIFKILRCAGFKKVRRCFFVKREWDFRSAFSKLKARIQNLKNIQCSDCIDYYSNARKFHKHFSRQVSHENFFFFRAFDFNKNWIRQKALDYSRNFLRLRNTFFVLRKIWLMSAAFRNVMHQ